MPNHSTITHDQLRTLFLDSELGGNTHDLSRFTYAQKGDSTYTFGLLQFDVGKSGSEVRGFLKENGFTTDDIKKLSQHGGLSHIELKALDAKLQAIPQDRIDQFTNTQLDKSIAGVNDVIDRVCKQNPAAAEAIGNDPKLQLSIADYENQFGSAGPQLVGFLAGNPEKLVGGTVQAGNPPTREDLQKFINATGYGHDKANSDAIESRAARFDEAMATLKLGPAAKTASHAFDKIASTLEQGACGPAVHNLQVHLAGLGYLDAKGIDDIFGMRTRHAVERFQHDNHLAMDGEVGPLTQRALHAVLQQHSAICALSDPQNPDHSLFAQALTGVHTLNVRGHPTEQQQCNLAAALAVEAKREGFTRIDQTALGDDGQRVYIAQHPTSPMELAKFGSVDTVIALQTPMAPSTSVTACLQVSYQASPNLPESHQPSRNSLVI